MPVTTSVLTVRLDNNPIAPMRARAPGRTIRPPGRARPRPAWCPPAPVAMCS